MLTLKAQILDRLRCLNVVALLDYVVNRIDEIYQNRLLAYAFNRDTARINKIRRLHSVGQNLVVNSLIAFLPG